MKIKGIKAGMVCDGYHDGKESSSRMVRIVVDDVFERDQMSRREQRLWRKALKDDFKEVFDGCIYHYCGAGRYSKQFWDWNCDMFIVGHIMNDNETAKDPMLFARCSDGGWYCVNWNYSLDLKGSVRKRNLKRWRECAKERGERLVLNRETGLYDYYELKTCNKVEK